MHRELFPFSSKLSLVWFCLFCFMSVFYLLFKGFWRDILCLSFTFLYISPTALCWMVCFPISEFIYQMFVLCYVLFSTFSNNLVWVCVLFSFLFHLLSMVTRNFNVCFSISFFSRFLMCYLLCTTRFLLAVTSYVMPFLKNRFFFLTVKKLQCKQKLMQKTIFEDWFYRVYFFSSLHFSIFLWWCVAVVVINSSSISSSIVYITTWLCVYVWVSVFHFASNLWTFKALCTDHLKLFACLDFLVFTELRFWRFGELNF